MILFKLCAAGAALLIRPCSALATSVGEVRIVRKFDVLFEDVIEKKPKKEVVGQIVNDACDTYQCKLRTVRGKTGIYVSSIQKDNLVSVRARLKGSKFDVEARAGGRLRANNANQIECKLMTPDRLIGFIDMNGNACANIKIIEYRDQEQNTLMAAETKSPMLKERSSFLQKLDSRRRGLVELGSQVVPVWSTLSERSRLARMGLYGGVDYTIERIVVQNDEDSFVYKPNCVIYLRPSYPLVPRLERRWPIAVQESKIRLLLSSNIYNIFAALSATALAFTTMGFAAFLAAQLFSFTVVPSMSMKPTLEPGSVLLVEKLSPKWLQQRIKFGIPPDLTFYKSGDIILFRPPSELRSIIETSKKSQIQQQAPNTNNWFAPRADLFVKRIAAVPGDHVFIDAQTLTVSVNGHLLEPFPFPYADAVCEDPQVTSDLVRLWRSVHREENNEDFVVPPDFIFVLGDCPAVSVDSRIWGLLPIDNIEARPLRSIFNPKL
uniref:Mitochondrial inner membrane protease subunit n=1 Tax=Aureoumbra lagunensis TaxID=44058 RepID=A0A7S3NQ21_9STRA